MTHSLLPYLVLYQPPQSKQLALQPVAAENPDDALAMAGAALVEQGLKDALVIGALDEAALNLMQDVMGQLKTALSEQG